MRESFTESTEAVLHDSDPRLLNFLRLSTDPTKQSGEGLVTDQLGTTLDLGTIGHHDVAPIPGVTGPRIGALIGGAGNAYPTANVDSYQTGSAGYMYMVLHFTDLTSFSFGMSANDFYTLAQAQVGGSSTTGTIDLTSIADLAPYAGKTLDSADLTFPNLFTTRLTGQVDLASTFHILLGENDFITHDFTVGTVTESALGLVIADNLHLLYTIATNVGTFTNQIPCLLTPYVPIRSLVDSVLYIGQLTLTFSDASTMTLNLTTQMIKGYTAAHLNEWANTGTIDLNDPVFGWDLSSKAGLGITQASWTVGLGGYTSAPVGTSLTTNYNTLNFIITDSVNTIALNFTNGSQLAFAGPGNVDVNTHASSLDCVFNPNGGVKLTAGFVYPVATNVSIAVGPAEILAQLNDLPADLGRQDAYSLVNNSVFSPTYEGWHLRTLPINYPEANYAVSTAVPMGAGSQYSVHIVTNGLEDAVGDFTDLGGVVSLGHTISDFTSSRTISSDARLQLHILLFPGDTEPVPGSFGSRVLTEAYELRQRNLPAFKLNFAGSSSDEAPTIDVIMWVSQGDPIVMQDNSQRRWTKMPIDLLRVNGWDLMLATPATISALQQSSGFPDNFGGAMITVPKEFIGPWNYIRFSIDLSAGGQESDLAGITLQIIANAREVI